MITTIVLLFFGLKIFPPILFFGFKIVSYYCTAKPNSERRESVGRVKNDIEMWNLRLQSKSQDPRFDRRSFRTFGRKSKPLPEPALPEPAVSYSALSGGVHIGFPNSSPPPPPPPTFAQIGSKKKNKSKTESYSTPFTSYNFC